MVTRRSFCQGETPSITAASSTSTGRSCNAARNISMKVPVVVQTARKMMTHMATEGPDSQSHTERPKISVPPPPGRVVAGAEQSHEQVEQTAWVAEPLRSVDAHQPEKPVDRAGVGDEEQEPGTPSRPRWSWSPRGSRTRCGRSSCLAGTCR